MLLRLDASRVLPEGRRDSRRRKVRSGVVLSGNGSAIVSDEHPATDCSQAARKHLVTKGEGLWSRGSMQTHTAGCLLSLWRCLEHLRAYWPHVGRRVERVAGRL